MLTYFLCICQIFMAQTLHFVWSNDGFGVNDVYSLSELNLEWNAHAVAQDSSFNHNQNTVHFSHSFELGGNDLLWTPNPIIAQVNMLTTVSNINDPYVIA